MAIIQLSGVNKIYRTDKIETIASKTSTYQSKKVSLSASWVHPDAENQHSST